MSTIVRPAPDAPRAYAFPRSDRHTLPNGLSICVAALHRLPAVTALLMFDAGAERDPLPKAGIGRLTASALAEGSAHHDADAMADAFERLGAVLDIDNAWARADCSTTVLAPRFADALRLLGEVARSPSFPEDDVARLRDERLAELLQQRAEPRGLATDMFSRFVFSAESRYAIPEGGNESTVKSLTRDDVVAHYQARYVPASARLIVAGDVDADVVFRLAEEIFGDWTASAPGAPSVVADPAYADRRVHLVAKSDAPQSELRIGHATVPRTHPDFYAIAVMNAILGGLFNSRINLNLRERHAFTYGAFSIFDWRRHATPFGVSTAVASDVTAAAVREVLGEIDRIRETPVSESEITLARDYLTGVFPIRFETTQAIADAIASREAYGLAPDYYDSYRDRIAVISAEDVLNAAQRHLDPARMQVVAVTDPETVRGSLEALGIGSIAVYESDGAEHH